MDVKKLVEEVLIDLGNNKALTDVSSKIQIIVRLLGDDNLKKWYQCEFVTGYKGEELPDYRVAQVAEIKADYLVQQGMGLMRISGQSVPVGNLDGVDYKEIMTVRFFDTISSIIEFSHHPNKIGLSLTHYERCLVQQVLGNAQIQNVYKVLSLSTLQTIIDNVRGRIIDLFMDLDEKVFNGELDLMSSSTKEEIHQVITNNITAGIVQTGSGVIDASQSKNAGMVENQIPSESIEILLSITCDIEKALKDTGEKYDDITQNLADIKQELITDKPRRRYLKNTFKAIAWSATISCKSLIEELVEKAVELL